MLISMNNRIRYLWKEFIPECMQIFGASLCLGKNFREVQPVQEA